MISGRGITKKFETFTALKGIDIEVRSGTIVGIIGHNGAGKTTILRILSCLISPSSGDLKIRGFDAIKESKKIKLLTGYLPEESRLYETMTPESYLKFFGEIYGLSGNEIQAKTIELLAALDLKTEGKKNGELSKGMKRKVAIARSLIHNPELLIYDEPTSGLDPVTSRFIVDYLLKLKKEGRTIVLSAHNLYQIEAICDYIYILHDGEIVVQGTISDLREYFGGISYHIRFKIDEINEKFSDFPLNSEDGFFVATLKDAKSLNELTSLIAYYNGEIETIESKNPSLEEIFFSLEQKGKMPVSGINPVDA